MVWKHYKIIEAEKLVPEVLRRLSLGQKVAQIVAETKASTTLVYKLIEDFPLWAKNSP